MAISLMIQSNSSLVRIPTYRIDQKIDEEIVGLAISSPLSKIPRPSNIFRYLPVVGSQNGKEI